MRYALLLHYPEMNAEELGPEALAEGMREFDEYAKALDAAIGWAGRAPSVKWGAVEIRPVGTRFVDGAWTQFDYA